MLNTRYSDDIVKYAVTGRRLGLSWNEVHDGIRERFNIEPPSERMMRTWTKFFLDVPPQIAAEFSSKIIDNPKIDQDKMRRLHHVVEQTVSLMAKMREDKLKTEGTASTPWVLDMLRVMEKAAGKASLLESITLYLRETGISAKKPEAKT